MLGNYRKLAVAGAALTLISMGLTATAMEHTDPDPRKAACVIAAQPAEVANVEYKPGGHAGQASNGGSWTDVQNGTTYPRFGLYYPVTDPAVASHPEGDNFQF